jgi:hypothetical protein
VDEWISWPTSCYSVASIPDPTLPFPLIVLSAEYGIHEGRQYLAHQLQALSPNRSEERERERERERETHTETHRHTDRQRYTEVYRDTETQRETHKDTYPGSVCITIYTDLSEYTPLLPSPCYHASISASLVPSSC